MVLIFDELFLTMLVEILTLLGTLKFYKYFVETTHIA